MEPPFIKMTQFNPCTVSDQIVIQIRVVLIAIHRSGLRLAHDNLEIGAFNSAEFFVHDWDSFVWGY